MKLRTKIIALVSAIILALCFFTPYIKTYGNNKQFVGSCNYYSTEISAPYTVLTKGRFPESISLLENVLQLITFPLPHLLGLLLAGIITLGLMPKTVFIRQSVIWALFPLTLLCIGIFIAIILWGLSQSDTGELRNIIIFVLFLSPLLVALFYSLWMLHAKYTIAMKLSIWQLVGSFLVVSYFCFLGILTYSYFGWDTSFYGLWLSGLASIILLIYSIMVCKLELNRPYKTLLFGILKLDFPTTSKE
jgi:hypothetical protein